MDLRGSPSMGGDRNHQRDDGSSEEPTILQASDIGRKGLHGEIQEDSYNGLFIYYSSLLILKVGSLSYNT